MEKKYCHIEPFNLRLFGRTILEDFACDFDKIQQYVYLVKVVQENLYY